ncbi:MAG: hypothetical protein Q7J34_09505 [Bacteroidales bacterium]|nr:hypothetical protein [Bacteroidales bacterium]
MKTNLKTAALAIVLMIFAASCEKSESVAVESLVGNYKGQLTSDQMLKTSVSQFPADAVANITATPTGIQLHCFGGGFDTTFMLNYFANHDSVMVCLTGASFNSTYGHMMGAGHVSGGMMGDINGNETAWMHHMSDEHKTGDQHYGGFNMKNHSFGYRFNMGSYNISFQGNKQ